MVSIERKREIAREATKRWRERNPDKVKAQSLANHYRRNHLSKEQYDKLVAQQNGKCATCQTDEPGRGNQGWHIDHDHSCCSGKYSCGKCIRGLLCAQCNVGLGSFRDSTTFLQNAIEYLKKGSVII